MNHPCTNTTTTTAGTIADKNNEALTYFLRGDFDEAVVLLKDAYTLFASFRHHYYLHLLTMQQQQQLTVNRQHQQQHHQPLVHTCSPQQATHSCCCCDMFNGTDQQLPSLLISCPSQSPSSHLPSGRNVHRPGRHHTNEVLLFQSNTSKSSGHHQSHHHFPCSSSLPFSNPSSSPHSSASTSSSSCPSTSSMYNRAFVLSAAQDDMTMLIDHESQTGAILLYNLGLIYHNVGIHLGVSAAVTHAIRLYQWSLSFIDLLYLPNNRSQQPKLEEQQQPLSHGQPGHQKPILLPDDPKLLLAILNNLSNLYTSLNCVNETYQTLYQLRLVLAASTMTMKVTDGKSTTRTAANENITNDSNNNSNVTNDDDFNWFFINALFQGKDLLFAPAA